MLWSVELREVDQKRGGVLCAVAVASVRKGVLVMWECVLPCEVRGFFLR